MAAAEIENHYWDFGFFGRAVAEKMGQAASSSANGQAAAAGKSERSKDESDEELVKDAIQVFDPQSPLYQKLASTMDRYSISLPPPASYPSRQPETSLRGPR